MPSGGGRKARKKEDSPQSHRGHREGIDGALCGRKPGMPPPSSPGRWTPCPAGHPSVCRGPPAWEPEASDGGDHMGSPLLSNGLYVQRERSAHEIRDSTLRIGQESRPKFFESEEQPHVKEVNGAVPGDERIRAAVGCRSGWSDTRCQRSTGAGSGPESDYPAPVAQGSGT